MPAGSEGLCVSTFVVWGEKLSLAYIPGPSSS